MTSNLDPNEIFHHITESIKKRSSVKKRELLVHWQKVLSFSFGEEEKGGGKETAKEKLCKFLPFLLLIFRPSRCCWLCVCAKCFFPFLVL